MHSISISPIILFLIPAYLASNCSRPPIYIPIHQQHVHDDDSLEYGTSVGFGSPAQSQSLVPSMMHNETSVADADSCRESNLTSCSNSAGGFFQPDESRTLVDSNLFFGRKLLTSDTRWKINETYKSTDINSLSEDAVIGTDTVHLYTHFFQTEPVSETTVDEFPLEVISNGSAVPGKLGLGSQLTLLTKLYDDSLISSRSFGLYIGNSTPQTKESINGSLTLGGYDSKRFTGTVKTYTMESSNANPFRVHVKQIILHDDGGEAQNVSLVKGDGFDAQITTDQYHLSLPADVTQAYVDALDAATPSGDAESSLRINKSFNGTMSVILSTGFTVKLENISWSNAVVAGRQQNLNKSDDGNAPGPEPEPFYLGGAWLSQVYLVANYDDNAFHLAQAVQDTDFVSLQTLCPGDVPRPYTDPDTSSFAKKGLVGAVIGGVGAAILLLYLGVWIYASYREARMRRKTVHWFKGTNKGIKVSVSDEEDEMGCVIMIRCGEVLAEST